VERGLVDCRLADRSGRMGGDSMPVVRLSKATYELIWECVGYTDTIQKACVTVDTVVYEGMQKYLWYLRAGRN